MTFMLKNSDGEPDGAWTLLVLIILGLLLKYIVAGIVITVHGQPLNFGLSDAAVIAAFTGPAWAAYTSRRNTDRRAETEVHKANAAAAATVQAATLSATSGNFQPVVTTTTKVQ